MMELIEISKRSGAEDAVDTLTLSYELRQKCRQRVVLDSGAEAAVILAPGTRLADGDVLRATDGSPVVVRAADETVSVAHTDRPLLHARACYHLGNRHVPLQIGSDWVRYQPDHVLDDMVRGLGLRVETESAPFEPERGAYHGNAHGHAHGHDGAAPTHEHHDH